MADDLTLPDLRAEDVLTWDRLGYPKPARGPLSKRVLREAYVELVAADNGFQEIVQATLALAKGVKHLMLRNEKGEFKRVADMTPEALDLLVAHGWERIEIWLRDPSIHAIDHIMNRVMDKPKEQAQEVEVAAKVEFSWKTEE